MSWGLGENEFRLCRKCGLGVWVSSTCGGELGFGFSLFVFQESLLVSFCQNISYFWRVFTLGDKHFLQTIVQGKVPISESDKCPRSCATFIGIFCCVFWIGPIAAFRKRGYRTS